MSLELMRSGASDLEFVAVFNRLLVALREPADDTGITQGVYFDALKDLPQPAIEAGAIALMKQPGRKFFPTTAEWRSAAELAQTAMLRQAVRPARDEPWRHECDRCEDTGWVRGLTCDGGAAQWPEQGTQHTEKAARGKGWGPWSYRAEERQTETPRAACCGRDRPHAPHSYTRPCPCRPTNRTYIRHQQFGKGSE